MIATQKNLFDINNSFIESYFLPFDQGVESDGKRKKTILNFSL